MKRLPVIVSVLLFAMTASHGAPTRATVPDFWYVLPATDGPAAQRDLVRGIVVPSTATPTVQTSPAGSVISWPRLDGSTQSFVVRGVSSFAFERGPLAGTTYIPFRRAKRLELAPDDCCACASWPHMEESIEHLTCVEGCAECGCEACICSPTYPCPFGVAGDMKLKANNGASPVITIGKAGTNSDVAFESGGGIVARFSGRRLDARIDARGVTTIDNPDSITLAGPVFGRAAILQDKAYFAWVSPEASVILEQPVTMQAPTIQGQTINFSRPPVDAVASGKHRVLQTNMDRCRVCGTHPDSVADLDLYDCVPGNSVCYRCVSWECSVPQS